jgi:hypothetical protein
MNLTFRGSRIVLAVAALALPLKAGGCGTSTACITVTSAQLLNGTCPSAQVAQNRFSDPDCPGSIVSVDSDGTLDDNLCCYSVTSESGNSEIDCGSTGDGIGGDTSFESSSTGFGGGDGTGGGQTFGNTCQDALNGAPVSSLSPASKMVLMSLQTCACNGTCMTSCDPTLCLSNAPDTGCLSCLQTSCSAQLTACHEG